MITPAELIEIATRHQVHLERLKTQAVNENLEFLKVMDKSVTARLVGKDITDFKRAKLERLIASVRGDLSIINKDIGASILAQAKELAEYEAGFEVRSLDQVVKADFNTPTASALNSAVMTNPLSVAGVDNGMLLGDFIKGKTTAQIDAISLAIRTGYYEGQTTNQVLQSIRGTRSQGFKNGIIARVGNSLNAAVRTALQHTAVQARETTWEANKDIVKQVRWTSTFDGRTSQVCRSMDGKTFDIGKGPRPPIHINCRSTMVGVLDERFKSLREGATRSVRGPDGVGSISAKDGYYEWLKQQPKDFQDSAIGPVRAKLMNDGGLSAKRFGELNLSNQFQPLTLAEMKKLEPTAFEKAGI